jgi:hypothetical protein
MMTLLSFNKLLPHFQFFISLLYLIISFYLPIDYISIIPYYNFLNPFLLTICIVTIANYLFQSISKYFGNKYGVLNSFISYITGPIFILLVSILVFYYDFENHVFPKIISAIIILLYVIIFSISFVIIPLNKFKWWIRFKILDYQKYKELKMADKDFKNKLKLLNDKSNNNRHYCPIHLEFKVQLSVKTNISFFDSGRLGS